MQIVKSLCLTVVSIVALACQTHDPSDTTSNLDARRDADAGPDASDPGGEALVDAGHADEVVTFGRVLEIFNQQCLPCHATNPEKLSGAGKLYLGSASAAYEQLVGVAAQGGACASSAKQRVVPGDVTGSLLMDKLENADGMCGAPMPKPAMGQAFVPIPESQIAEIAAWIKAGAAID